MAIPRKFLLPERPVWTHVVSRCVRKAYLCGGRDGKWDHRRQWVEERLRELVGVFAVEIAFSAISLSDRKDVGLNLLRNVAKGGE